MAKISGNTLVARALQREGAEVIFYLAGGPMFDVTWDSKRPGGQGFEVTDHRIVQQMAPGDLVVTADIPLARR